MRYARKIAVIGLFGLAFGFCDASAQERVENLFDRDRNTSVTEREHSEYSPVSLQRGAFLFRPRFALGVSRAINVFASPDDDAGDIVLEIRPSLDIETSWARHQLRAGAEVSRRQFFELSDESEWNWSLDGAARIDVQRYSHVEGGLRYASQHEARTEAGEASRTIRPIEYDQFDAVLEGRHTVGRILIRPEIQLRTFDYHDEFLFRGGIVDQDFRDYERVELALRGDYALSPNAAVFVRVRLNDRNYELAPPIVQTLRDSSGYTIDGGADFDIRGIARGVFGVGYTKQDYQSPALSNLSGVSINGLVEWFPTQLTTVALGASRGVREAPFAASGGYFATETGISVDHELRRNIILSAGFSIAEDDYTDFARTDQRTTFDAGIAYFLNRTLGVRVGWTHIEQDRGGAGRGYTSSTFGVTLVRR